MQYCKTIFSFIIVMAFCGNINAQQQALSPKQQQINTLIKVSGAEQETRLILETSVDALAKQKPNIPAHVWAEIKAQVNYKQFISNLDSVYNANCTIVEIRELVTFYKTTADKSKLSLKPELKEAIYKVSKQFGKSVNETIAAVFTKNGLSLQ
ncbi:MAG: hypothetical protein QM541_08295 [Flavobacterium sp.]|nr:hypothetical protein [Flavobacterium sp.]